MKILGRLWAIIAASGELHESQGEPLIFANKGPHAEANAAKYDRTVERVVIMSESEFDKAFVPKLTSLDFNIREGQPIEINAQFAGESMRVLAAHLGEWFRRNNGQNFFAMEVTDPVTKDVFDLTMQRMGGKTPAVRLRELEAALRKIRDTCERSHQSDGRLAADIARSVLL
jgi:hypothetical protein